MNPKGYEQMTNAEIKAMNSQELGGLWLHLVNSGRPTSKLGKKVLAEIAARDIRFVRA